MKALGFIVGVLVFWLLSALASAQFDPQAAVPADIREQYRNQDGSCVYCSIGMMGVDMNNPNAASILHDSEYGQACRGGAWPQRVIEDFQRRGIDAWHVEGNTKEWLQWCWRNGRTAAVTLTPYHMQWCVGFDTNSVYVVDNNSPQKVDEWSHSSFWRQHEAHDGGWAVILKGPRPASWVPPERFPWWEGLRNAKQAKTVGAVGYDPAGIPGGQR